MDVILLEDMDNLGYKYDTVTVKNGYGRNFLIPKEKAVVANSTNTARIGEIRRQIDKKEASMLAEIQEMIARIKETPIKVGAKVGTTGKIFGSVTNVQLAEAIKKETGIEVDRRKISIKDEIKQLGEFKADVSFHNRIKESITFEVVAE